LESLTHRLAAAQRERRSSRAVRQLLHGAAQEEVAMNTPDPESDGALFVYGSLLDAAHRATLLGREVAAAPARFEGYERRRGRYLYILVRAGGHAPGPVLSGLVERDFAVLDRYEEVPRLYTRVKVEVMS